MNAQLNRLTQQYAERNIPVASCIGGRTIGGEEPGFTETSRDGTIFDAPVLMDGGLSCGQNMLKTSEGSLESGMADNRLVGRGDVDTHFRQEDRVDGRGEGERKKG